MTPRKTSSQSRAIRPKTQRPSRSARPERERSARDGKAEKERCPLGVALPLAREIERQLHALVGAGGARIAGSVRRRQETVGDLNFVAAARRPAAAFGAFASLPEVAQIRGRGHARIRVRLHGGMDADLHVVPEASLGAALLCFTGSSGHHRALRRVAHRRKLELNEYGLFRGERMIAGRTEADVYRALGLAFVPPELREDAGEIAAARDSVLPPLIEHGDLRGDLRVYVDARRPAAVAAVACAAGAAGLEYLALTCTHAANVVEHARAVRALRRAWPGLRLLAGAEVAIRRDGSLELDGAALADLDVVTAVIRDHRDQPRDQMTRRIVRAMENPHVDLIAHPASCSTAFDLDAVIAAARRTATVLAIDPRPDPIALRGDDVRRVLDAGVRIAIDSGASEPGQLALASEFGIALARRGWARRCDVINALPVWQCLCQLKTGRRRDPTPVATDHAQWDEPPQPRPRAPRDPGRDAAGCAEAASAVAHDVQSPSMDRKESETMQLHWHHPELFSEQDRAAAEDRIRALARDHTDLIDVRISARTTAHHRRGAQEVRITCEARGKEIVAARTRPDPGLALNEALDTFEREIWRMRQRRTQQRKERPAEPPELGVIDQIRTDDDHGFVLTDEGLRVYFHRNALRGLDFERLSEGQRVALNFEAGDEGPQATYVAAAPPDSPGL